MEGPSMIDVRASDDLAAAEAELAGRLEAFGLAGRERLHELPLFVMPHVLRRMLMFNELYRLILDVPGVVMGLGVRYGRDLATLDGLRTVYEPLNHSRRIVGFDTFSGFPSVAPQDGEGELAQVGTYATGIEDYDAYLAQVLATRERLAPFAHLRRFELRRGDATRTLPAYLDEHPETIVALAYLDFDVYEPTKACLEALQGHLTRGSVLAFDELNCPEFPGETVAVKEVLGLGAQRLRRLPGWGPGLPSYLVVE